MVPSRRHRVWRARATLLWTLLAFAALQVAANCALEFGLPEIRDPEYGVKAAQLKARRAEFPERPLVLVLGTSRTMMGLQAGWVTEHLDGPSPLVFNFGMPGAGPLRQLVCLRRLLADGVKPDLLFLEVLPLLLNQANDYSLDQDWLQGGALTVRELAAVWPRYSKPRRLLRHYVTTRLVPWASLGPDIRRHFAPNWSECPPRSVTLLGTMDRHGYAIYYEDDEVTPENRRLLTDTAHRQYRRCVSEEFQLARRSADVLHCLLALCRDEAIPVALVLMPEGKEFQSWYGPPIRRGVDTFIQGLAGAWQVPVIDARTWVDDQGFWDSHHMLPSGAAAFTRRFATEAVGPLMDQVALSRYYPQARIDPPRGR